MDAMPTLPGLGDSPSSAPPLTAALRRTFQFAADRGILDDRHAATMALALYLADALAGSYRGKGASTAMLAREYRETLALLPEPVEDAAADAWRAFEADFRAAATGDTA